MASGKRRTRKRKQKRSDESYIQAAKQYAPYVPKLKKYTHRKKLKASEKSAIRRKEKQLLGVTDLKPVTKKQARYLHKNKLFPGTRAVRLKGVSAETKIRVSKKGSISFIDRAEHWVFWPLERDTVRSRRGMKKAAADAFAKSFPIEIVQDLAATAFARMHVQDVYLWTNAGAVGQGFQDFPRFQRWVNEKWHAGRYMRTDENNRLTDASDPGLWVNGIAIKLEDPEYQKRRKEHAAREKQKS